MKATLIGLAAASLIAVATPASAQSGDYGWRHRSDPGVSVRISPNRAYARDRNCSVRVTTIHRPNGTTVTRRVRRCD
jgi:hypothetical protein